MTLRQIFDRLTNRKDRPMHDPENDRPTAPALDAEGTPDVDTARAHYELTGSLGDMYGAPIPDTCRQREQEAAEQIRLCDAATDRARELGRKGDTGACEAELINAVRHLLTAHRLLLLPPRAEG